MYKADTDEAQLPPLPLEAWDMIITWIRPRKALYPVALVCTEFAALVGWHLRPRLKEVNNYKVDFPDDKTIDTRLFIDDNGVPSMYLVKEEEYDRRVWLLQFMPMEYHFKRLCKIQDSLNIVAGNSRCLVFTCDGFLIIVRPDFSKIANIPSENRNVIHVELSNDHIFVFSDDGPNTPLRMNIYSIDNGCALDEVYVNYDYIRRCPIHILYSDGNIIMIQNGNMTEYNIKSKRISIFPDVSVTNKYTVDAEGLLMAARDDYIDIYAKNKLLHSNHIPIRANWMICSRDRIYILTYDYHMWIYKY